MRNSGEDATQESGSIDLDQLSSPDYQYIVTTMFSKRPAEKTFRMVFRMSVPFSG